jgi:hypothetical protein
MQLIIEAEGALTNADNLLPVGDELSNTIRENKKAIKDIRERFKF